MSLKEDGETTRKEKREERETTRKQEREEGQPSGSGRRRKTQGTPLRVYVRVAMFFTCPHCLHKAPRGVYRNLTKRQYDKGAQGRPQRYLGTHQVFQVDALAPTQGAGEPYRGATGGGAMGVGSLQGMEWCRASSAPRLGCSARTSVEYRRIGESRGRIGCFGLR